MSHGHHELVCPSCGKRVGGCRCIEGHDKKVKDIAPCWDCRAAAKEPTKPDEKPLTHPVQRSTLSPREPATAPQVVTMRAYEVYCALWGEQAAMVTGGCRGGFGVGELIAFLYARSFPREEWSRRVDEAFEGLNV